MHQHHVVLLSDQGDGFGRSSDVLALDVSFERLATTEQSIATRATTTVGFFMSVTLESWYLWRRPLAGATPSC